MQIILYQNKLFENNILKSLACHFTALSATLGNCHNHLYVKKLNSREVKLYKLFMWSVKHENTKKKKKAQLYALAFFQEMKYLFESLS